MPPFRVLDNPYEDIAEGYFILNTNIGNTQEDHDDMLSNGKAAAYFDPWKFKIERLAKGDVVFLYQNGVGIVAFGEADSSTPNFPLCATLSDCDELVAFLNQRSSSSYCMAPYIWP